MHPYPDALNAMHDLLAALGERQWRAWIADDIALWARSKSVQHHLAAYGGMGSFNDITFEDVWLGTLFQYLQDACYYFAHHPEEAPEVKALARSMGMLGSDLYGWRCLSCGYGAVSRQDIERFLANAILRRHVLAAAEHRRLQALVHEVVSAAPSDPELTHDNVAAWATASGVHVRMNNGWMRPCPGCGSDDTGVYRWVRKRHWVGNHGASEFVSARDNLPLRGR